MTELSMYGRIDSVTRMIEASPNALYQAYLDADSLVTWLPPSDMVGKIDRFEPEVGGGYGMTLTYGKNQSVPGKTSENTDVIETKFVELIPNKKIVSSSIFDSDNPAFTGEMKMTVYFEAVVEGTKVIIIAENVPDEIKKEDHLEGLNSSLENLEDFVLGEMM